MLNHSLSPTTPLPTSHPSIRTDKIPSALGSNATATTASSDFSSTPHPLTPSTSHDHQAGDETGRLKSPNAVDSQASYAINQPIISAQRSPRAGISPTEATTPKLAVNAQNSSNSSALLPSHTVDPLYTTQPSTRRRMLTSTFLPFTKIKVTNSHIRANEKNKEVISFSINVNVVIPPESDPERKGAKASWVVEKFYSDVLALDHIVKSKHSKSQKKTLAQPPDRALFKDHAPSKVDARKAVLERYLESLCSAQLKEKGDVCEFFNSNIVINERSSPSNRPGFMQGYLTKKGRNFGGWQTRYYVLDGPVLEYFDSRGGTKLGFLGITGAQIGRQQQQRSQDASDDSYRHAFLIRMHKEKEGEVDHILCAETDEERDAWVEALTCYVSGRFVSAEGTMSTSESSNRTPTGITSSPASNGRSRRQTSLDGFNRSETSSFNPQHQSSTSQDMRGETKTKIRASGMPKSNSSNQATVSTKSDLQAPLSKAAIAEEQALPMRRSTSKERPLKQELSNVAPETRDQFSRAKSSFADHRDNLNRPKLLEDRGNQLGNPANNGPTTPRPVQARLLQQAQSSPQQDQTTSDAESALNSSIDRPHTPDPQRPKISGPMNGAPITGGYRLKPVEEKRAKFRSAFWGFGGRNAGNRKDSRETSGSSTAALKPAPRPVFGVSLQEAVSVARVHEGLDLPAVVFRCVEFLEAKGAIEEEGIYRLSGSSVSIKAYKDRFNTEGDYNLLESSKNVYHDVHAVAGLLKQFLRELGSPILPRDLQPEFLKVIDLSQRSDKVNELGRLCAELPLPNYTLLRFLSAHLIHIVQNEKVNKMSLRNVGIVFSPTLGIPAPLFALLLREFDLVFNIEGDNRAPIKLSGDESVVNKPHGEKGGGASGDIAVSASKRLSRNSILYSATGADMLLEHSKLPRSKGNIESDSESDLDYDSSSEPDEEIIASVKSNKIAEKQQRRKTLIQPNFEVKSDLIDDSTKSPFALSAKSGGEGSSGIGKNNTTKYNGNVLSSPRPKTAGG
ncbi:expressed protein [Phakopsora pachyrhizi]|uniref:Expressed protein n=1 Tax=Phakopsora pachyrhizi TaxID=170000 RepID=A0AAV0AXA5_PHAPC|nr:expressed protein [Phakopsora pachyrhizi]